MSTATRPGSTFAVAAVVALLATTSVLAQSDDIRDDSHTTYSLLPDEGRVFVQKRTTLVLSLIHI